MIGHAPTCRTCTGFWLQPKWQVGYSFSTTCGYILSISISLDSSSDFASPWWGSRIGYRLPDAQVIKSLALGWRNLLHRQPARATSTRGSKKHKNDGLAAAVKPTISLLKVSDIETEAPPSPCTNYGKLVKSWLCFWKSPQSHSVFSGVTMLSLLLLLA